MAIDHAQTVLAGFLPDRREHLVFALQHLEAEHFRQESQRKLFQLFERYYDITAYVLPRKQFIDLLESSKVDPSKILLYTALYDEIDKLGVTVTSHEFKFSVDQLKDQRAQQLTGEAITASFEVLEHGLQVGTQKLTGHNDARQFLYSELAKIDRLGNIEESPEGDMREETYQILEEYAARKSGKIPTGIKMGIAEYDSVTGGIQPGEMVLVCAYTGEGKSLLCVNTAHNAVVKQGKNLFFATSETIRPQVMRRFSARHSRMPQFNCPTGIDSSHIKDGTLTEEHEEIYQAVLDDIRVNPNYGRIYIAQIPRGATLGFVEARLRRVSHMFRVDLVVIDYLALLKSDTKRQTDREDKNEILRDAKVMATSANDGDGVAVVSPWAMSQAAMKEAKNVSGRYALGNLADTSEAEKSSDTILSMLRRLESPKEVLFQMLKNRDGELPPDWVMGVDYRNGYFGPKMDGAEDLLLGTGNADPFSDMGLGGL